ncbi:hypothetical protein NL676_011492 [Syzygium grande]|nr:hypothetical protein NL676_011492 [Syzygium grande]
MTDAALEVRAERQQGRAGLTDPPAPYVTARASAGVHVWRRNSRRSSRPHLGLAVSRHASGTKGHALPCYCSVLPGRAT